jgi:hypothetical protein
VIEPQVSGSQNLHRFRHTSLGERCDVGAEGFCRSSSLATIVVLPDTSLDGHSWPSGGRAAGTGTRGAYGERNVGRSQAPGMIVY